MSLDWILNPITIYALAALTLVVCTCLFLAARIEVHGLRRTASVREEQLAQERQQLTGKMEELESTLASLAAASPAAAVVRPSMNLTRRAQALRMRRRGETVESISAALTAPRNEVELLLKVQHLLDGAPQR